MQLRWATPFSLLTEKRSHSGPCEAFSKKIVHDDLTVVCLSVSQSMLQSFPSGRAVHEDEEVKHEELQETPQKKSRMREWLKEESWGFPPLPGQAFCCFNQVGGKAACPPMV